MVFGFIFSIIGLYSGYIISIWISIQIVHFISKQDIEFRYQSPCFYDPVQFFYLPFVSYDFKYVL